MSYQNKNITEILDQIHAEGYKPGTPQFDFMYRKRRVERCQELRGASSCQRCSYFDSCELVKEYLRDVSEIQMKRHVQMVEAEQKRNAESEARTNEGAAGLNTALGIQGWKIPGGVGPGSGTVSNTSWYAGEVESREPSKGNDGSSVQPTRSPRSTPSK